MQLQMRFTSPPEAAHDDAHGGEAFQVQSMQQSLQTKGSNDKPFRSPHHIRVDNDFSFEIIVFDFGNITKEMALFVWLFTHGQLCYIDQ